MVAVVELVLGAVLGAVVTELVLLAKAVTTEAATFKNRLEDLESDLQILSLKFNELDSCTQKHEAENLIERGRKLVDEGSTVRLLNLFKIKCCASKLKELKISISKSVMIIDSLVFSQQINFLRNQLRELQQRELINFLDNQLRELEQRGQINFLCNQLRELQQRESTVRDGSSSVSDFNQTEIDSFTEEIIMLPAPRVPGGEINCISLVVENAESSCSDMALEDEEPSGHVGDDFVVGASVGTGVSELYHMVEGAITNSSMFNTQLKQLKSTLEFINGLSPEMLNTDLDGTSREILNRGKQLLNECSTVNFWNLPQRYLYAKKLLQLDRLILKIFESVIQLQMIRDSKIIMEEIKMTLGGPGRVGTIIPPFRNRVQ